MVLYNITIATNKPNYSKLTSLLSNQLQTIPGKKLSVRHLKLNLLTRYPNPEHLLLLRKNLEFNSRTKNTKITRAPINLLSSLKTTDVNKYWYSIELETAPSILKDLEKKLKLAVEAKYFFVEKQVN